MGRVEGLIGAFVGGRDIEGCFGGRFGSNGCKAFRFFAFLTRQGIQVLKILLPRGEEASFKKVERRCFCRHEEQYFESIEEVAEG
jgi:hypothetical protein